jgi:lipoprotein Spr
MRSAKLRIFTVLFLVTLFLPQVVWAASSTLQVGDKGWKVKTVQIKLNTIGVRTPTSGRYTGELSRQVRDFQKKNRLRATGKVDDATYKALLQAAFNKEGIKGVNGSDIVRTASRFKGVPYGFGGTTPRAFDCSGYVQYVFRQHRAVLPRTADQQYEKGMFVTQSQLQPGDLVFFSTYEPGASHVGIYAGSGKFWNATSSRGVQLCGLGDEYWRQHYYGAKRVLSGSR